MFRSLTKQVLIQSLFTILSIIIILILFFYSSLGIWNLKSFNFCSLVLWKLFPHSYLTLVIYFPEVLSHCYWFSSIMVKTINFRNDEIWEVFRIFCHIVTDSSSDIYFNTNASKNFQEVNQTQLVSPIKYGNFVKISKLVREENVKQLTITNETHYSYQEDDVSENI